MITFDPSNAVLDVQTSTELGGNSGAGQVHSRHCLLALPIGRISDHWQSWLEAVLRHWPLEQAVLLQPPFKSCRLLFVS